MVTIASTRSDLFRILSFLDTKLPYYCEVRYYANNRTNDFVIICKTVHLYRFTVWSKQLCCLVIRAIAFTI